jgi:ribosome production factor 2
MKKSGTKTPHIELEEIGPAADLVIRRTRLASSDLFKTACRTPAAAKVFFLNCYIYLLPALNLFQFM